MIKKKKLIFRNNAPFRFRSCISKINNIFIENSEDLDIVIPIYNCINIVTAGLSGSLQNYYRDEVNDNENKKDNSKKG